MKCPKCGERIVDSHVTISDMGALVTLYCPDEDCNVEIEGVINRQDFFEREKYEMSKL